MRDIWLLLHIHHAAPFGWEWSNPVPGMGMPRQTTEAGTSTQWEAFSPCGFRNSAQKRLPLGRPQTGR